MPFEDAIRTTYGSCIHCEVAFTDENGQPEDISDDTFGIAASSGAAFENAALTKIDPMNGRLGFFLSADDARKLLHGKVNWFRLSRLFPDGCRVNSEPVWVSVI